MANRKEFFLLDKCTQFSIGVIRMCEMLPQKKTYWIISDQLVRAATSVGANIAESRGASSRADFKKFFEIALKSANETHYWLNLLDKIISVPEIAELLKQIEEIRNMTAAAIIKLKSR